MAGTPAQMVLARSRANQDKAAAFWNQAKRDLRCDNGVPHQRFLLFVKECERRFNYGPPDTLKAKGGPQLDRLLAVWKSDIL